MAWLSGKPVRPVKQIWDPGGIEDVEDEELGMEEDAEEADGYGKSDETVKIEREADDRIVRKNG